MKLLFSCLVLLSASAASAQTRDICFASTLALRAAINVQKGLALASQYEKTAKACGISHAICDNNEPGTAFYFYKAQCLLAHAERRLSGRGL